MNRGLKILFLGGHYPYKAEGNIIGYGGGEISEYKLATALKEAGAKIKVISMDNDPLPPDANEIDGEIEIVRTSRRFTNQVLRGIEGRYRGIPIVLGECKKDNPDIILAYSINRGIEASVARIVHNVPFIVANSWGYPRFNMSSMNDTLLYAVSLAWRNADAVIFPSAIYAEEVQSNILWMKEVKVIPNGVDPDFFRLNNYKTEHNGVVRFISTSRVIDGKGIEFLVEASKGLFDKKVAHTLDIVGEGPLEERIRGQAAGYEEAIRFHGHHPYNLIPEYLQNADVFVLPSKKETFGNVVLEAMASGLAVISTPVGICPEILDDKGGLVVEYGDVKTLFEAMEQYCLNPDLPKNHGHHNSIKIKDFPTWEQVADMYMSLMLEILN